MRMHPMPRIMDPVEKELLDRFDCEWTITVPEHLLKLVIHSARTVDTRKSAPLFITRAAHKDHPLVYFHTQMHAPRGVPAKRALWAKLEPCKHFPDIQPILPDCWRVPLPLLEHIPFGHGQPITIERTRHMDFKFRCAAWEQPYITVRGSGMDRLPFSTADKYSIDITDTDWLFPKFHPPKGRPIPNDTGALLAKIGTEIGARAWEYALFSKAISVAIPAFTAEENPFTGLNTLLIAYQHFTT